MFKDSAKPTIQSSVYRKRRFNFFDRSSSSLLISLLRVLLGILSGPMLKEKAEDLAKKLGNPSFVATEGWLSRWKAQHQIRYKRAHGEKGSADTQSAEE